MIKINFKKCCYTCGNCSVYDMERSLYSRSVISDKEIVIGCEHEKVCKSYLEEVSNVDQQKS